MTWLISYLLLAFFFDIAMQEVDSEKKPFKRLIIALLWPVIVIVSVFVKVMK